MEHNFDFASSCHHKVTLTQNATLAAPSNQAVGQSGSIFITQPSSGNYTVAYNSALNLLVGLHLQPQLQVTLLIELIILFYLVMLYTLLCLLMLKQVHNAIF